MLLLINERTNVKRKFFAVYYTEIFNDNLLFYLSKHVKILDVTRYDIKEQNDFLLVEYNGELPEMQHPVETAYVTYSKMNVKELLNTHYDFLVSKKYNMKIDFNILTHGGMC